MAYWLGTGAVEQIWRPTWARGGYDLRQVVSRWLRLASSCGGGSGLRSGVSSAYTRRRLCWWLRSASSLLVVVDLLVRRLSMGWC
jgi:hypothetical protein